MTSIHNPYESPRHVTREDAPPRNTGEAMSLTQVLFSFEGRIPRRTYWGCSLGLIAAAIAVISMASGLGHPLEGGLIFFAICPAVWIQLALQVKRWHDRDKSGWWVLIGVIPIIGRLYTLVETGLLRGTEGPNRYGPDPT